MLLQHLEQLSAAKLLKVKAESNISHSNKKLLIMKQENGLKESQNKEKLLNMNKKDGLKMFQEKLQQSITMLSNI